MENRFYVYEHKRLDTGAVFYVGKGSSARIRSKQGRNTWWSAVVEKSGGYEASKLRDGLDEEMAHLCEIERIDQLRRVGVKLCNLTDGGDGMSGYRKSPESIELGASKLRGKNRPDISARMKGIPKSDGHRAALSAAMVGKTAHEETRNKMSAARIGKPIFALRGRSHTEKHKKKISEAVSGEKNPFFGKKHTLEAIGRTRAANLGRKDGESTRLKKSAARMAEKNPRFGVSIPEDQKLRQIAALKARPRVTCPHCGKSMDESNAKRWHFDNCKERK